MKDELATKIEDLTMIIDVAEGNYKTALETKLDFTTLREMKGNIRQLKPDCRFLKTNLVFIKFHRFAEI